MYGKHAALRGRSWPAETPFAILVIGLQIQDWMAKMKRPTPITPAAALRLSRISSSADKLTLLSDMVKVHGRTHKELDPFYSLSTHSGAGTPALICYSTGCCRELPVPQHAVALRHHAPIRQQSEGYHQGPCRLPAGRSSIEFSA